ncbi:MAG: hydantoinase B/oxoprolinase family protein, partial [Pseudorhodoplanes sp.]
AAMPIRFTAYELVPASGGAGLHRGGAGVRKTIEVLVDGVEASILGERTLTAARGVGEGRAGAVAQFSYVSADGNVRSLPAKSGPHRLAKGDRLEMITAGGGGWGRTADDDN